jgi:hypothetical protein
MLQNVKISAPGMKDSKLSTTPREQQKAQGYTDSKPSVKNALAPARVNIKEGEKVFSSSALTIRATRIRRGAATAWTRLV